MEAIKRALKNELTRQRYLHSLGVSHVAAELASRYGADAAKGRLAGLLHDVARDLQLPELLNMAGQFDILVSVKGDESVEILHAPVGAEVARRRFGVRDEEVLQAIRLHTTGGPDMTLLDRILFVADLIEPSREFPWVQALRNLAWCDLDSALLAGLKLGIEDLLERGKRIHPHTIAAWNWAVAGGVRLVDKVNPV